MTLVEIEKSNPILPAMVFRTPIWCFVVYEVGQNEFSWMAEGKLGRTVIRVGSLTIDSINYGNAGQIDPMALPQKMFCQIGNIVYVRTENDNPVWVYYNPKYNSIIGFTDGKPCMIDGVVYKGGIDYIPQATDEADNLEYGKMKFTSENITLTNTKGEYDAVTNYFGNNVRVKSEIKGVLKGLYEYYIKNVKIKEDKTTFVCGDRRENLRQKIPEQRFTIEEYPKIKPELEGEIKQDVYGECEWVKCVCVDELDIYDDYGNLKQYRTFYAARKITHLKLIDTRPGYNNQILYGHAWIKQTQPESGGEVWTPCPVEYTDKPGEFRVNILYCMPPTWLGYDVPEVYEVRACGMFWAPDPWNPARPLDIIKELLLHYCRIPYDQYWYKLQEIESEIGGLAPIGIVYDGEIGVFEAIEKLQNASDYGFRFTADYNLLTARKDDNNRGPVGTIRITDIVDIGKAELDMQQENYATIIDVAYKRNYYHDIALHYEGRANRYDLLNVHGVEKIYKPETYLINENDARNKASRLESFYRKSRIMIKNIEVRNWPDLRVYDIVYIDLRIPLERKKELKQIAVLFEGPERENVVFGDWPGEKIFVNFGEEEPGYRGFGGILTCKVMSIKLDTDTGVNTLNLLEVGQ